MGKDLQFVRLQCTLWRKFGGYIHAYLMLITCCVPIIIATCMYVFLFQEVVEEPATDGDSDHTNSGGSVVDSMEACE